VVAKEVEGMAEDTPRDERSSGKPADQQQPEEAEDLELDEADADSESGGPEESRRLGQLPFTG
jgi:hypothetical protein